MLYFFRLLHSTLSAFKESRDRSRGQGAFLSLVDNKSRDDLDDACADIDMTMNIVQDFSNEIFSNIEQLNRNSLIVSGGDNCDKENKNCNKTLVYIEDETDCYRSNKNDTLTKDSEKNLAAMDKCREHRKSACSDADKTLLERRRVSLPEITALPNIRAIKIR